mgnify:CR=1 FL=1|tara:strand:- start:23642 stop:24691 length:1050 start_codon:yes stop_codon:yes gene_type:complete
MQSFWKDKRVLITGHTGFKGSWLSYFLLKLGSNVSGISLNPTQPLSLFDSLNLSKELDSHITDIRDYDSTKKIIEKFSPDIIFHLAAQALVIDGYKNPLDTFSSNVMGTANILNSLRYVESCQSAIFITTDKVYMDQSGDKFYKEDDRLGGNDPYSASKASSEIVINSFKASYFQDREISISTARAGNVIGGGDWSEYRIIPDAVKKWVNNESLEIRNPSAVRPWQHVLEPITGYMKLVEKSFDDRSLCGPYNFGPDREDAFSVEKLITEIKPFFRNSKVSYVQNPSNQFTESDWLALDNSKMKKLLNIKPKWKFKKAIEKTGKWYSDFYSGSDARDLCEKDMREFISL